MPDSRLYRNVSIRISDYERILKIGEVLLKDTGIEVDVPKSLRAMIEKFEKQLEETK